MYIGANSSKPHLSACRLLVNKTENISVFQAAQNSKTNNEYLHFYEAVLLVLAQNERIKSIKNSPKRLLKINFKSKWSYDQIWVHCTKGAFYKYVDKKRWVGCQQTFENKEFVDITQQHFAFIPQVNLPDNNLSFHWRWRWRDWIQAMFLNILYFT